AAAPPPRRLAPRPPPVVGHPDPARAHLGAPPVRSELDLRRRLPRRPDRRDRHGPARAEHVRGVAARPSLARARRLMRYGVIGAGVLGMTATLRLLEHGHEVTILEAGDGVGGLAGSFEIEPGMWLEKFYHHIFRSDRHIA